MLRTALRANLLLAALLASALASPGEQQQCSVNSDCRSDECAVSDPRGGMKCVPSQYAVMVWDGGCLNTLAKSAKTRMEAPLKEDGEPDLERATVVGLRVDYSPRCGRVEVRGRGANNQ